jgi:thiol-disulfide isomerase/thioredoxin
MMPPLSALRKHALSLPALALTLALLPFVGCEASTGDGGGGPDGSEAPVDRTDYPPGPYGTTVGTILDNLVFEQPGVGPLSLQDLRSAEGAGRYLFVNTAAWWCGACIEEQPALRTMHEDFAARGLTLLVTVFENARANPASVADAERWRSQFNLPFAVVQSSPQVLRNYYDTQLTPLNMLVNLASMEIVYMSNGNDIANIRRLLEALL